MPNRLRELLHQTITHRAILSITWILAATAIIIGLILCFYPHQLMASKTFDDALKFAPPHVWGIGFLGIGIWTTIALRSPPTAQMPLYLLGILNGAWGCFAIPTLYDGAGSPTAIIAYAALGIIATICGAALGADDD